MNSAPFRDPLADHLITPQNAAPLLIDYQRDWARQDTAADVIEIVLNDRLRKE